MRSHASLAAVLVICCIQPGISAGSGIKDVKRESANIARRIMKDIRKVSGNICILDFSPPGTNISTSEFGQFLAETLTSELLARKKRKATFKIVDRWQLVKIMRDSVLFGNDPNLMDELRKKAGMDYLISGTYHATSDEVLVEARVISAKTGEVVSSHSFVIPRRRDIARMITRKIRLFGTGKPLGTTAERNKSAAKLSLEVAAVYLGSDGKLRRLHEEMILTSDDHYALYLRPAQDCYAYIYQVDSEGNVLRLFPNANLDTDTNPLEAGKEYWVPNDREFLFLDENTGTETIYVIVARSELPGLRRLISAKSKRKLQERMENLHLMGVGGKRRIDVRRARPIKGHPVDVITKHLEASGGFYHKITFGHE